MSKAIIFGVNGQDGYYLQKLLEDDSIKVTGVSRSAGGWIKGDVGDAGFTESLIRFEKPNYIFHLAANSKTSHEFLREHQETIVNGTFNILEAVYRHSPATKVFIAGSGLQFDNSGDAINEASPFKARDAYSLARVQSVYTARYYRQNGIKAYVGYLFHHDSPIRKASHLNRRIADAAIAAGKGLPVQLEIGNTAVEKEFGFAKDIANGIFRLLQQDTIFEACIGTGKAYSIEKWLELCFSAVGKNWKDYVRLKEGYVPEFNRLLCNPALIQTTGWQHKTTIEQLANMMMDTSLHT